MKIGANFSRNVVSKSMKKHKNRNQLCGKSAKPTYYRHGQLMGFGAFSALWG